MGIKLLFACIGEAIHSQSKCMSSIHIHPVFLSYSYHLFLYFGKLKSNKKLLAAFLTMVKWFGMCSAHNSFAQGLPVIITDEQREPVIVSLQINCHSELRYERLQLEFQIPLIMLCHFRLY